MRLVSTKLILPEFLVSPSARGQEEKVETRAGEKKDVLAVKGVCKTEMREPIKQESIPRGIMWDHVCEYPLRFIVSMDTKHGAKLAALTLIFLDLQVRQPVRVFRCVFRAEGFVFMPFGWSIAAGCPAPSRNVQEGAPEIAGQAGQLPAFESESQCEVRVLVRQRAGEALRIAMAAWSDGEETGLRTFVQNPRSL